MNCLEFRRWLAIEPGSAVPEFAAHGAECQRCSDAYARAQDFDRALASALAVPVPEGLEDRILLRQTTSRRHERRAERRYTISRLAAALVLAVGVAAMGYLGWRDNRALPDAAVAHLSHEPYALAARAVVSADEITAMFSRAGVVLEGTPDEVNYLRLCRIGRNTAVHMVVQRDDGPVTVLFIPARHEQARSVFERAGLKGRTIPMGDGTLVLLASDDRSFDVLEHGWRSALGAGTAVAYLDTKTALVTPRALL